MFALSRILDQLTRLIAKSKGRADWQKYPKNRQSIRNQQPETLESKTCHAFPGKGVRLKSALLLNFVQPFRFLFCAKGFNSPPAHSNPSQAARAHGSGVTQPTGQCSSRGLFLNQAVLIAASNLKQCQSRVWLPRNPNGGPSRLWHGWSGWRPQAAPDVRHQRPGEPETTSGIW